MKVPDLDQSIFLRTETMSWEHLKEISFIKEGSLCNSKNLGRLAGHHWNSFSDSHRTA